MKILVPIDGSSYSQNSLAFLASRSTLLGDNPEIDLLVVFDELPIKARSVVSEDSLKRFYEDATEEIFKPARKIFAGKSVKVTEAFALGSPAEVIAEQAQKRGSDLIIMGSRGRTALAGLFLGSVTTGVLARTKLPILILRNKPAPVADAMRVGIAVDGSEYSMEAVNYVLTHRSLFGEGAEFYLINVASDFTASVIPDMAGMSLPMLSSEDIQEMQRTEFLSAVEPLREVFAKKGIQPKEVCLVGIAGDEIAAFAKNNDLSVIVMGSHGYGRFKSAVMGSTAMRIAAQGDVPILVLRH